jgi:hypothetical protein
MGENMLKNRAKAVSNGYTQKNASRELAIAEKIQKDIATEGENNLKKQAMEARKTEKDVTARHKRQLDDMRGDVDKRQVEAQQAREELYRQGRQKTREVL